MGPVARLSRLRGQCFVAIVVGTAGCYSTHDLWIGRDRPTRFREPGSQEPTEPLIARTNTGVSTATETLRVVPVEGGSWASQIAAIEANPQPVGATFHVRVVASDTANAVPCERYGLQLDARGATALRVGRCNPDTAATEIVLVDRLALFEPGDPVAVAQPIGVRVFEVRQGYASGGADISGGVEFQCSASVRPFVRDPLTGASVYLSTARYHLEPLAPHIESEPVHDGWIISVSGQSGITEAEFRVVDTRDGREVTRSRVAMNCRVETPVAISSAPDTRAFPLGEMR